MRQYHEIIKKVLSDDFSYYKPNRTHVNTISRFGHQCEYNLQEGFPILTTKKLHTRSITEELLWFLRGERNVKSLKERGVTIWDEWADENGDLGPIYGFQWRSWSTADGRGIDQINNAITQIKQKPDSRRIIVNAWNVGEIDKMALPPCHLLFHLNVRGDYLDCLLYQRSCDTGLGVPFNIASYATLTHLLAQETGLEPGLLVHTFGDLHIYCGKEERGEFYRHNLKELKKRMLAVNNHEFYLGVKEWIDSNAPPEKEGEERLDHVPWLLLQLSRHPGKLPKLEIAKKPLEQLIREDSEENFKILDYNPHSGIRMNIAV